ncbi:RNA-binding region-containing protein 3-like [Haliotis rubra]|uniref:RNA-binding region-containing protein 3-like n=1 Tax=Haliotis rubra TaxID=36100 RepID=UPI001EE51CED|nr:RNA-binding region-containing protein 3-like [Haliotis rubra]
MVSSTLLIRHLPSDLTPADKDDLLRHFGAVSVQFMGTTGPMKHAAFAGFTDQAQAAKALTRLHQLDVLGSRLKAEFAKESLAPDRIKTDQPWTKEKVADNNTKEKEAIVPPSFDDVYHKWSINYPRNPRLHYMYPPPTVSILTNIANALASYPKFYVQVLHLMNKMNVPTPFGVLTTTPPIPADLKHQAEEKSAANISAKSTSSESEIESGGEGKSLDVHVPDQIYARKRKRSHKKARLMIQPLAEVTAQGSVPPDQIVKPSEVFEQVQDKPAQKKIQLKLPSLVSSTAQEETGVAKMDTTESTSRLMQDEETGGFGRMEPVQKELEDSAPPEEDDWVRHGFVSQEELDRGRLPMSELKELSVFRRYERGEPSCRLYLKNLAKQVTDNELRFIYGRFIDVTNEQDLNIFDVRLMKEGKMKGQAFVTFPSEDKAIPALEQTNGYILNGKPIVVQFARSAKQK